MGIYIQKTEGGYIASATPPHIQQRLANTQ